MLILYLSKKDYDKLEMSCCEAVEIYPERTKAKETLLNLYIQNAVHDSNLTIAEENCEKAICVYGITVYNGYPLELY